MRRILTLVPFLAGVLAVRAQSLTNVVITPPNPTECTLLTFNFIGTMPQNANFTGFAPNFGPDSLIIALSASGGGGSMSNFNQQLPGIGPFAPGTYTVYVTFTLNGNQVGSNTQTITIAPGSNPDPGEYGEIIGACTGGPSVPLISILGGTPDTYGVWIDPNGQVVSNGLFVPGQSPEGFYTYNFDVQKPCIDASQIVFIQYASPAANAGLNSTVQACQGFGAPINLFASLGGSPDNNGTWTFNGAPHSATFNPVSDACGAYVYTVPGIAPCPSATATVTVQCVPLPNAGNVSAANDTIHRCYNDTTEQLQVLVTGEQNTGYWIGPTGFGVGLFNANINLQLNGPGFYGYVVPSALCPNDTSFIYVMLWGDSTVGCTVGLSEDGLAISRFDVMPNPAQDEVTIEVEAATTGRRWSVEMMDVDGRVVRSLRLTASGLLARQTFSVGDLARGVYLVRAIGDEGRAVRRLLLR